MATRHANDVIVTLIGESLARMGDLAVLDCPVRVAGFSVKQHWNARFHQDAGNKWLRGGGRLVYRPMTHCAVAPASTMAA